MEQHSKEKNQNKQEKMSGRKVKMGRRKREEATEGRTVALGDFVVK